MSGDPWTKTKCKLSVLVSQSTRDDGFIFLGDFCDFSNRGPPDSETN
ncbi:unnamed protein product [Penicillium roqueforti FM164]|uniref:Genomic scaffold, ProqFM164S04 n=1 Tax=Penicillium roqueforti (strain FM164) TaxID=1365484 RepID=W6QGD6_PENRF|nr:unnamed protein product [Penicillium roqueforti FM164]